MKKEIIVFHWSDASMHGHDQRTRSLWKKSGLIHGIVCGHIVHEDKKQITVATDLFYGGQEDIEEDNFRTVSSYPKSGINKIYKRFELQKLT